jgi:lysophospholipase L1-like esterase
MTQRLILHPTLVQQVANRSDQMSDGTPKIRTVLDQLTISESKMQDSYVADTLNTSRYTQAETTDICWWGDSLTRFNGLVQWQDRVPPSILADLIYANRSQDVWVINRGIGGESSQDIYDRIALSGDDEMHAIQIFWMGRNDSPWDASVRTAIKGNIADAIGLIRSTPKRYLVMSILNGNYAAEYAGQTFYNDMMTLNDDLAALYPNNFLDIRQTLIDAADPVADATDIANDIVPGSLRSDNIHLNETGDTLVATTVYNWLLAKGWI